MTRWTPRGAPIDIHGLSAFPLSPMPGDALDEAALARMASRMVEAGVDSIGALGSTGSYPYLDRRERRRVARTVIENAAGTPVLVGIGALRTSHVLELAQDAQSEGAAAVLLAPMSYQPLTPEDVLGLYEDVTAQLSVPLVVYDNPTTTHVRLSDDLLTAIASLPGVASIKIPPVPVDAAAAQQRIQGLRARLPESVGLGISGDPVGVRGLIGGCEVWYSAIAGVLPRTMTQLTRAVQEGRGEEALAASERLEPLWELLRRLGSLRLSQAIGELHGLVEPGSLVKPLRGPGPTELRDVSDAMAAAGDAVLDRPITHSEHH